MLLQALEIAAVTLGCGGDRVQVAEVADVPVALLDEVMYRAPDPCGVVGDDRVGVQRGGGTVDEDGAQGDRSRRAERRAPGRSRAAYRLRHEDVDAWIADRLVARTRSIPGTPTPRGCLTA